MRMHILSSSQEDNETGIKKKRQICRSADIVKSWQCNISKYRQARFMYRKVCSFTRRVWFFPQICKGFNSFQFNISTCFNLFSVSVFIVGPALNSWLYCWWKSWKNNPHLENTNSLYKMYKTYLLQQAARLYHLSCVVSICC